MAPQSPRSLALLAVAFLTTLYPANASASTYAVPPHMAIERAVAERLGPGMSVTVSSLETDVMPTPGLEAVPDQGGRAGVPVRFQLLAHGARVGTAVAVVKVRGPHARATKAIGRDEMLTPDTWQIVTGELADLPFRHLPTPDEIPTLKTRRDVAPGEVLTDAIVTVPPLVRSGERVDVTVRIGAVEASGTAIASGSGHLGDTIHIMQRASRRLLSARISGPGAVELIP
jgi:flagella basal body P-ring formation protein FlgA